MIKLGDAIYYILGDDSKLGKSLSSSATGFTKLIGTAVKAGAAIGAALTGAAKMAADFQDELAKVSTLGITNLDKLANGVKNVAMQFGQDATEAARQLYQVISAGVPEGSAIMVLEGAAKGAAAGVGQLSEAVDLGTSVLNAWNMNANEMESVMGKAVTAVKLGKTTISEMATSVGKAAPLLADAGVSASEFFAAVAAGTQTGAKASVVMTQLQQAVSNMIKPTKEAQEMAASLGVQFDASALKTHGLAGMLQIVKEATGGNVEQMGKLFGSVEALNGMLALTGNQAEAFEEALEEMASGQENLNDMFEKATETNPKQAFRELWSTIKVLAIDIGELLLPALGRMAQSLADSLQKIHDWFVANEETVQAIKDTFNKFADAVDGFIGKIGELLDAWDRYSKAYIEIMMGLGMAEEDYATIVIHGKEQITKALEEEVATNRNATNLLKKTLRDRTEGQAEEQKKQADMNVEHTEQEEAQAGIRAQILEKYGDIATHIQEQYLKNVGDILKRLDEQHEEGTLDLQTYMHDRNMILKAGSDQELQQNLVTLKNQFDYDDKMNEAHEKYQKDVEKYHKKLWDQWLKHRQKQVEHYWELVKKTIEYYQTHWTQAEEYLLREYKWWDDYRKALKENAEAVVKQGDGLVHRMGEIYQNWTDQNWIFLGNYQIFFDRTVEEMARFNSAVKTLWESNLQDAREWLRLMKEYIFEFYGDVAEATYAFEQLKDMIDYTQDILAGKGPGGGIQQGGFLGGAAAANTAALNSLLSPGIPAIPAGGSTTTFQPSPISVTINTTSDQPGAIASAVRQVLKEVNREQILEAEAIGVR